MHIADLGRVEPMANTKKFVVKNGLRAQNVDFSNSTTDKSILADINDSGILTFQGASGNVVSLADTIEGSVFSVNEQSGVPSLEIFTDGTVRITESTGNVLIGTDIDNGLDKVQIAGDLSADRVIADLQGDVFGQDSTKLVDSTYGEFNGFVNGQVSSIDNHTTDDLDEGEDNLYFTKQRARRQARIMALIFGSC